MPVHACYILGRVSLGSGMYASLLLWVDWMLCGKGLGRVGNEALACGIAHIILVV